MMPQQKLIAIKRVTKEFEDLKENPILNIGAQVGLPDQNNVMEWKCTMLGPQDTPFGGGLFYLKIKFPDNYPQKPPEVSFLTPIYHINVNPRKQNASQGGESLGHVCISTLNWWNPKKSTIKEVLHDIFALFYMSNPKSPYGIERAYEFQKNRKLYDDKCRYFTQKYAAINIDQLTYTNDWDFSYPNK